MKTFITPTSASPSAKIVLHPAFLFTLVNASMFALFALTPDDFFEKVLLVKKGDVGLSAMLVGLTIACFVAGTFLGQAVHKIGLGTRTISRESRGRQLYWLDFLHVVLMVVAGLGMLGTFRDMALNPAKILAVLGHLNYVKQEFYDAYTWYTAFRVFMIGGWIIRFALTNVYHYRPRRLGLIFGIFDAICFFIISSRLVILMIMTIAITLKLRSVRSLVPVVATGLALLILGSSVFLAGVYLRGAVDGKSFIEVATEGTLGYFVTPFSYLPEVVTNSKPVLAPQMPYVTPLVCLLKDGNETAALLAPNDFFNVCDNFSFYYGSYTPLSLFGQTYIDCGSVLLTAIFVVVLGLIAGVTFAWFARGMLPGILTYPLIAATIVDSYRLPLITQNIVFQNLFILAVAAVVLNHYAIRQSAAGETVSDD